MTELGKAQNAFSNSVARLMTTGTPFRIWQKLPWVKYKNRALDLSPPHGFSYGYGFSRWNKSYSALSDKVVRDVVIVPWDGVVNFTIKEYREGQLINEEEYNLKMSTNIDEEYKDILGPDGEIITNRSDLRSKLKSKRRKAVIACGTANHPMVLNT